MTGQTHRICTGGRWRTSMHMEIPDELGATEEQARLDFAVGLYTLCSASLARAARLAGRSRIDFQRILAERGIAFVYVPEDLEHNIATLKELPQL
ncbi:MAG: hypothetical protein C5B60_02250 [Chloroflexi bacterium]|nr:MAG: hypothetical protein C5B60_02250 [Chloroflexota bacterium]